MTTRVGGLELMFKWLCIK